MSIDDNEIYTFTISGKSEALEAARASYLPDRLNDVEVTFSDVEDPVNQPKHYTNHPSGIECIQITEHMGFNLGNAMKYIWRCDLKKDAVEDLKKARWYLDREIAKREGQ